VVEDGGGLGLAQEAFLGLGIAAFSRLSSSINSGFFLSNSIHSRWFLIIGRMSRRIFFLKESIRVKVFSVWPETMNRSRSLEVAKVPVA
jgi:hypothetical protein